MDTDTRKALTVLIDYFCKEEAVIHETLELLQQIPGIQEVPDTGPEEAAPPSQIIPTKHAEEPETAYTYEQVRKIFTEKISHGLKEEAKAILTSNGLKKLSDAKDNQHLLNQLAAEAEAINNA